MDDNQKSKSIDLRGLMDDPYCPDCGADIPDSEIDAPNCPYCGCLLDWKIYHIVND